MISYICNVCGETLKRHQDDQHRKDHIFAMKMEIDKETIYATKYFEQNVKLETFLSESCSRKRGYKDWEQFTKDGREQYKKKF